MSNIIAILSGRFHPFHKGHLSSYNQLKNTFGENTYLGLSQKVDPPDSPFDVDERAKMAMCLGIPRQKILGIKQPYNSYEYINRLKLDPKQTVVVFAVSQKDMNENPRFTFENDRRMQPYPSDGKNLKPITNNSYVYVTNTTPFQLLNQNIENARDIRRIYNKCDNNVKETIVNELYGKYGKFIKPLFDSKLNYISESVYEKKLEKLINLITESKLYLETATPEQKIKLNHLIKESYESLYECSDYLTEGLTPPDKYLNKYQLSSKEGNEVWWKNIMVGYTTGKLIDDKVEFTMSDDGLKLRGNNDTTIGTLPLDKVSIRQKKI